MKLNFTKMQGCGNDYIYFNCFDQTIDEPEQLSRRMSDRHLGIGGDGIVLILPSAVADAKMRMFNIDGSEGKMCGNAVRCVGRYLYEHDLVHKTALTVETLSGIKRLILNLQNGAVETVTVDMGAAALTPASLPTLLAGERLVDIPLELGGECCRATCVSMGNPHCVVFCQRPDELDLARVGARFEHSPLFPERVNTEFVEVLSPTSLSMRVWERGSGETMACGTGACAAAVAAVENGHCRMGDEIAVRLRGGVLSIRYTPTAVFMTGRAEVVFEGSILI